MYLPKVAFALHSDFQEMSYYSYHNHDDQGDGWLVDAETLETCISAIIDCKASSVNFNTAYSSVYRLVMCRRGRDAYDIIKRAMQRMALSMPRHAFVLATDMIVDVALYLERVWMRTSGSYGGKENEDDYKSLAEMAQAMYSRKVAVHWRRVRRSVKVVAHISRCLVHFTEARFTPGGSGAVSCKRNFTAYAIDHQLPC